MRAIRWGLYTVALLLSVACTPAYTEKTGVDLAGRAGITDSVSIERSNQRLLSRQGQVCLLSDMADTDTGKTLLRTMQAAFNGYFVAVGVEDAAMDYLQAAATGVCPGAAYLFFVQSSENGCLNKLGGCGKNARAEFIITIVNRADQSLLDRVKFSVKNSWLPWNTDSTTRLQNAFEQLAQAMTGAKAG